MASLVEELIDVLSEEERLYRKLSEYGEKKRQILIDADISELEKLTEAEQAASDELLTLSNKQTTVLSDIAEVLGKRDEKMTVTKLIGYLNTQPDIQSKLSEVKDKLLEAAAQMQKITSINAALLQQAIEFTEFDITLFKSMRQAPETANYNKNAYSTGTILGSSGFDAKQ